MAQSLYFVGTIPKFHPLGTYNTNNTIQQTFLKICVIEIGVWFHIKSKFQDITKPPKSTLNTY